MATYVGLLSCIQRCEARKLLKQFDLMPRDRTIDPLANAYDSHNTCNRQIQKYNFFAATIKIGLHVIHTLQICNAGQDKKMFAAGLDLSTPVTLR